MKLLFTHLLCWRACLALSALFLYQDDTNPQTTVFVDQIIENADVPLAIIDANQKNKADLEDGPEIFNVPGDHGVYIVSEFPMAFPVNTISHVTVDVGNNLLPKVLPEDSPGHAYGKI